MQKERIFDTTSGGGAKLESLDCRVAKRAPSLGRSTRGLAGLGKTSLKKNLDLNDLAPVAEHNGRHLIYTSQACFVDDTLLSSQIRFNLV